MIDYHERPEVPPDLLVRITNTLARWLPSDADAAPLTDWPQAAWRAAEWIVYWQNALPWFVKRLRETDAPVPKEIGRRLSALDADSRERTRLMLDDAAHLLDALATEGIEALPFKGAALAPLYYPDPLLRPMGDLDLLVHRRDIDRGIEVMKRLGYRFYSRSAEDEVYLKGDRRDNVWAPDNVHPVEMHYTLREEYAGLAYNLAPQMWRSAQSRPYWRKTTARIPRPSTLLHHVCAHATSDWLIQRGRLMHLDDIRKIAAQMTEADWRAFREEIPPFGARFVYPILAFAVRYAAPPIPAGVLEALAAQTPTPLKAWIANVELGDTSLSNPTSRSGLGLDMARLLARSPAERGRMWLRSFFPRRRNLTKRYPRLAESAAWPLCYLRLNVDRAYHLTLKTLGRE